MPKQPAIITTKRCRLHLFDKEEDLALLQSLRQDANVTKHMFSQAYDEEFITSLLERYESYWEQFGFSNFAVFHKETGEFMGNCGVGLFHDPDGDRNPFPAITNQKYHNKDIELGYAFRQQFWYQGYATEVASACCDFVFTNFKDIPRIVAVTTATNFASQNVLKKIGFDKMGALTSKKYGSEEFFALERKNFLDQ